MIKMSKSQLMKVSTDGVWTGGVQTEISIRDFAPFKVDEPTNLGGKNEGPNPVEFVLAGLSSCTSVMISIIAKEQGFTYEAAEFKNEGTLDLRGLMGVEGISAHFQSVEFDVILTTDESEEKIQKLKDAVEKRCPVMSLLVDAGVSITCNWIKK